MRVLVCAVALCVGVTARAATTGADAGAAPTDAGVTPAPPPAALGDTNAPDKVCLASLRDRHVEFIEWPTKGVRTPIRLVILDRKPGGVMPVMDCELGRALLDAAAVFQMEGIRDLYFSGTYEYRTRRRSKKMSEHAHGLAIDVHQFGTTDGRVFDVERDFEQGVGEWPSSDQVACIGSPERTEARTLRELACALHASSAFREIITADDNSDHYNHFHIESFADPLSRAKALLAHREPTNDD